MRLAVFSDVHSNHYALEACLKEAEKQKADGYIFLGDYISDCANPHETMKLIYRAKQEMPCWFVRGNREEYVLNHHNFGAIGPTALQQAPFYTPTRGLRRRISSSSPHYRLCRRLTQTASVPYAFATAHRKKRVTRCARSPIK